MPICNRGAHALSVYLRIIWNHKVYLLVYLVLMSLMGVFIAMGSVPAGSREAGALPEANASVAVIDRDGSAVSRGLAGYLGRQGELVEIADTKRALQDAVAQETVDCLLVVPAGYGEALAEAARTDADVPAVQSVVSTSGALGTLVEVQAQGWLQAVYGFVGTLGATPDEAVALADEATAGSAEASITPVSEGALALSQRLALRVYLAFSVYPIFAVSTISIALLMRSLNQRDVRQRILVAPTRSSTRSLQLFGACTLLSLACWLWIAGLGVAAFGQEVVRDAPVQVGVALLALLVYVLFAGSVGFLLGQLGIGEQAANALANVGGMVLSFLGGAWVGIDMMPPAVVDVARFTPTYWAVQAIESALLDQGSPSQALGYIAVTALFVVAAFAAAVVVGRVKMREA